MDGCARQNPAYRPATERPRESGASLFVRFSLAGASALLVGTTGTIYLPMSQRPLFPEADEVARLVPKPGSLTWRVAGDARIMAASAYALMLQVAHPTIASGVREHSNYEEDPWGRLLRTLDYVNLTVYGGPETAGATGRNLRQMHKRIRGVAPDGTRYSALEPEAYAWVHATLADAIVVGHARFGNPLSRADVERLWHEWVDLGRVVGVREGDLPASWAGYLAFRDRLIAERLEPSDVVDGVLATLASPMRPPIPVLNDPAWKVVRLPIARAFRLATVGLMAPRLRAKLGLSWTRAQELELRAIGAASRATGPLLPQRLRCMGPPYLEWRRQAIGRGELSDAAPALPATA